MTDTGPPYVLKIERGSMIVVPQSWVSSSPLGRSELEIARWAEAIERACGHRDFVIVYGPLDDGVGPRFVGSEEIVAMLRERAGATA